MHATVEQKIDAIYTALFGLEGQPDTGRLPILEKAVEIHDDRIRQLENWRWFVLGICGLAMLSLDVAVRMWGHG